MQEAGLITFVTTPPEGLDDLASRLKWAREERKLSQTALAAKAGVTQGTIGNLESRERKSARKLASIAAALRVNPLWLEAGRGSWEERRDATVFDAPSSEELKLLEAWRRLLGSDRRAKLKEITELAMEREAQRQELFEEAGLNRIAESAALHVSEGRKATLSAPASSKANSRR